VEDATKNLKTLENPKESMVKKRCLMKMNFGNYRQQMEVERRNVSLGNKTKNTNITRNKHKIAF